MSAIFPVIEPGTNGLTSPVSEQPRLFCEAGTLAVCAARAVMYGAGPTWPVSAGPKPAAPVSMFWRMTGTGVGAVTRAVACTTDAYLETAPTEMTLSDAEGRLPVAVAGPLLPCAQTPTTPASTAASAACTIGSGQSSVFWWLEPQELLRTSAPSATASSIAFTISTTQPLPFSNPSVLLVG